MRPTLRRTVGIVLAAAIAAAAPLATLAAAGDAARLEGFVVAADGRPAPDHAIVLIDDAGAVADRAVSDADGLYRFDAVDPGRYGVGIELPDGTAAPVVNADARLRAGELARRDIRLIAADGPVRLAPGQTHGGLVLWWVGLSPAAKTAVVVGAIGAVWLGIEAFDDDDPPASPTEPAG